ncbi:MAG: SdiA-regulated domain-containing protein [Deltaproteobacteria bacterium]|nr:SdiA-regulated domain-containing protein [Deltaproteobacteria bacterium]
MNTRVCLAFFVPWICVGQMGCSSIGNAAGDSGSTRDASHAGETGTSLVEEAARPVDSGAQEDSGVSQESPTDSARLTDAPLEAAMQADGASAVDSSFDSGNAPDSAPNVDAAGVADDGTSPDTGEAAKCPPLSAYGFEKEVVLSEIPSQASGIAWNRDSGSFFVVANLQGKMWEYDSELKTVLRTIMLQNMDTDTEGIAYLQDGWVAISVETNYVYVVQLKEGVTTISGSDGNQVQVYQPCGSPSVYNAGLEGIAYQRPRNGENGRIFTCQEYRPMRVLQFDYTGGSPPFTQKSALDGTLAVDEPWNAERLLSANVSDIAGMTYDETNDTLLIVSQESSCVIRVNPQSGEVTEKLSLVNTTTSEGITLFDNCRLAVVSEPDRVQIYSP